MLVLKGGTAVSVWHLHSGMYSINDVRDRTHAVVVAYGCTVYIPEEENSAGL